MSNYVIIFNEVLVIFMIKLKNIIFDLDGTLWQTKKSYIYAYHKLCDFYHIENKVSDDTVLKYMGVKLDILLNDLFPDVLDKYSLAYQAMNYSIEYLIINKDDCCYTGVYDTLKNLSKNYNIYIVSNCLDEYVKTFLNISNTIDFVNNFYTIESGTKEEHIRRITNDYTDYSLFVGDSDDDYLAIKNVNKDFTRIFFCYASYGYMKSLYYDYKIDRLDLDYVVNDIELKLNILDDVKFKVISYNGSSVTLIKKQECYYFGFVHNINKEIFPFIDEYAKSNNIKRLLGPINNNTWYSYRFSLDNFDFNLYPDCNNDENTVRLFYENGYNIVQYYSSSLATINYKIWDRCKRSDIKYDVIIKSGNDAYLYLDDLYKVARKAFRLADYYEEINLDKFKDIYIKNISLCNPDLIMIFDNKELVAFNFCYEDLLKRFYVCKTIAIDPIYQKNRNIFMKLVDYSYQMMEKRGYDKVLYHFQNERTKVLNRIVDGYLVKKKMYGLLEKKYE